MAGDRLKAHNKDTGISRPSALWILDRGFITDLLPPDISHVLFEGEFKKHVFYLIGSNKKTKKRKKLLLLLNAEDLANSQKPTSKSNKPKKKKNSTLKAPASEKQI